MNRQSRLWLAAAGAVAAGVAGVVLVFGYTSPPHFPSLYADGGPTIEASVAHLEYGPEDCIWVLDVASGESRELFCDNWAWPESWDDDGNLLVHADDGNGQVWVLDPRTGEVLDTIDMRDGPQADEGGPLPDQPLRSHSNEGRVTLTRGSGPDQVTLIDVEAPRDYRFNRYGFTADGDYAWVSDSEDRLLVVALDGTGGPWLVAESISDPLWK